MAWTAEQKSAYNRAWAAANPENVAASYARRNAVRKIKSAERITERLASRPERRSAARALRRAAQKIAYAENRDEIRASQMAYWRSAHGKYVTYKKAAGKRGLEFYFTEEEFGLLLGDPCYYCGDETPETKGVDRVDNYRGYAADNVVSCCSPCNYAKRTTTHDQFIARCKRVAARFPDTSL